MGRETEKGTQMTKRELCKLLLKIRDYLAAYEKLLLKDNCLFDADDLGACADALRDLILDLAAPEEVEAVELMARAEWLCTPYIKPKEKEAMRRKYEKVAPPPRFDAPEEEKKEPPVLIYEENGEKVPCPVCGAPAAPIKNKPGVFLCKRCEGLVCAEEGK